VAYNGINLLGSSLSLSIAVRICARKTPLDIVSLAARFSIHAQIQYKSSFAGANALKFNLPLATIGAFAPQFSVSSPRPSLCLARI